MERLITRDIEKLEPAFLLLSAMTTNVMEGNLLHQSNFYRCLRMAPKGSTSIFFWQTVRHLPDVEMRMLQPRSATP